MSTPFSITNGLTASIQKKTRLFQNVFMIFFALFFIYNVYNIQLFTISVLPEIVGSNSSNFERNQPVLFTNITISNIQITLSLFTQVGKYSVTTSLFTTQYSVWFYYWTLSESVYSVRQQQKLQKQQKKSSKTVLVTVALQRRSGVLGIRCGAKNSPRRLKKRKFQVFFLYF